LSSKAVAAKGKRETVVRRRWERERERRRRREMWRYVC
jgi:hypothetical protein